MTETLEFATMVAGRMRTAEHSLDQTFADFSLMMHDLTRHRAQAGFAAQTGHRALMEAHAAQTSLLQARTQIIDAHNLLARDARRLGLDPALLMGPEKKLGATATATTHDTLLAAE